MSWRGSSSFSEGTHNIGTGGSEEGTLGAGHTADLIFNTGWYGAHTAAHIIFYDVVHLSLLQILGSGFLVDRAGSQLKREREMVLGCHDWGRRVQRKHPPWRALGHNGSVSFESDR